MSREGIRVAPLSSPEIARIAEALRSDLGVSDSIFLPIVAIAEFKFLDGFEVLDSNAMGNDEGRSYPDIPKLQLRQDVYDAACRNEYRARFTIAHEIGHMQLHCGVGLARARVSSKPVAYENSEWQADEFAGAFLAPFSIIRGWSVDEISARCGISLRAAQVRNSKAKHR